MERKILVIFLISINFVLTKASSGDCEPVSVLDNMTVDISGDDFNGEVIEQYQNKGQNACNKACCNTGNRLLTCLKI